jgi:hypothetical protein
MASEDKDFISKDTQSVFTSYTDYVKSEKFGEIQDSTLHVGLLPLPYIGNLRKSKVFILMLNPGLSATDYFGEYNQPEYRRTYLDNLHQNLGSDFPFHFLNPEFAWHEGFQYWHRKFKHIARVISEKRKMNYTDSLKLLSQNVSCLELMPYHSKIFKADALLDELSSVKVMVSFVKDYLYEKAQKGNATIIVTRKAKTWGLPERKNVIIYNGIEARSAHLTPTSKGGKAILESIDI